MTSPTILAIVPARGGSKGLPGKNIRPLAGLPLIAHSIRCAALSPWITRCIVSTDSPEIAAVAQAHQGDVPFLRPAELAQETTPMMPVLQHALAEIERAEGRRYDAVLLLDPTSPARIPSDIARAVELLTNDPAADGVIACSEPTFNPFWVGVVETENVMRPAFDTAKQYVRRQDVPRFLRINGALYLWRRDFLANTNEHWLSGRHLVLEIPEERALSIDTLYEFQLAELLVTSQFLPLPWLKEPTP